MRGTQLLCGQAAVLGERIRQAIADHTFIMDEVTIKLSVSIGITTSSPPRASIAQLFHKVDQAMYQAKAEGRDRVTAWSDTTAVS